MEEGGVNETRGKCANADFQMTELLARVDNDLDLLRELLEIFKEIAPKRVEALREAVERGDAAKAVAEAHALKGMLSNLAAKPAAEAAGALEQLGRTGKVREFAAALVTLEARMDRLQPAIDACLAGVHS